MILMSVLIYSGGVPNFFNVKTHISSSESDVGCYSLSELEMCVLAIYSHGGDFERIFGATSTHVLLRCLLYKKESIRRRKTRHTSEENFMCSNNFQTPTMSQ